MFDFAQYKSKIIKTDDFLELFKEGYSIFIHSGSGEPVFLVNQLQNLHFKDLDIYQLYSINEKQTLFDKYSFRHFFVSEEVRDATLSGVVDYIPINLSQIPLLFEQHRIHIDIALIQTSLPDNNGFLSLGTNIDITLSAVKNAVTVIAQVNSNMPRTLGNSFIHFSEVDYIIEHDEELLEINYKKPSERAMQAAENASTLINNEDTIQVGVGTTAMQVLKFIYGKKNIGIHTEIFYDDFVDLAREKVITCTHKTIDKNKIIASFVYGTKKSYSFVNNNPLVEFHPSDYTNNPFIISQNNKMVSINSALEVDLLGQVNAEAIGINLYSGIGGFLDFNVGTVYATGGKSIIVLPSVTQDEKHSRIVPEIKKGYGITLSKVNVHYIVTEFGLAYLFGKTLRERALALISIAHPNFRGELFEYAKEKGLVPSDQIFPMQGTLYPKQYETYFTSKTGKKIFVRPLKAEDEDRLRHLLHSYSDDKLYQRFFCFIKDFSHKKTQCMVNINYEYDMALGCFFDENFENLVATAGYFYDSAEHIGEIAFMVRPDFQGEGIATFLNDYLVKIAKERGLRGFKAYVLRTNKPMLTLFHKSGYHFCFKGSQEGNVYELELIFDYK